MSHFDTHQTWRPPCHTLILSGDHLFADILILASRIELLNTSFHTIRKVFWRFGKECRKYSKEEERREEEAKMLLNRDCNWFLHRSSVVLRSFFVLCPVSFHFYVLNPLYGPLGVLFMVLWIFISFSYHQWSLFFCKISFNRLLVPQLIFKGLKVNKLENPNKTNS